jgi:hypothetical protein
MKPLKFMKIMEAAKVHEAAQVQVEPMPLSTPKKECQACRKLTLKKVTFDICPAVMVSQEEMSCAGG